MTLKKNKVKWKRAEVGGWSNVDVDRFIWCPCDVKLERSLYCQDDCEVVCPGCGKTYRVITKIIVQEKVEDGN